MLLLFLIVASALPHLTVLISLLFTEKSVMHLYHRMILIRMYLEKLKELYVKLMLFNKFSFQFVHVRSLDYVLFTRNCYGPFLYKLLNKNH